MKIAFSGASGSGKTTLVSWLSKELGLTHISASAGDLMTTADKEMLKGKYGYTGDGHADVIRYGNMNPEFAVAFQQTVLMRRNQVIHANHPHFNGVESFVTDRSPLDNIVYWMLQVAHQKVSFEEMDTLTRQHREAAIVGFNKLDLVIHIMSVQPDRKVEDNGSRIANFEYQQMVDLLFQHWLGRIEPYHGHNHKVLVIDRWDLTDRKLQVMEAVFNVKKNQIKHGNS